MQKRTDLYLVALYLSQFQPNLRCNIAPAPQNAAPAKSMVAQQRRAPYAFHMAKNRLSPEAWIAAGFRALAEKGPQALKAEPLARALETTKGSFYWHFADVPAFHAAMLNLWEERAVADVIASLESEGNPIQRLRKLGSIAAEDAPADFGGPKIEPAIRAWARDNALVTEAVDRVDAKRMGYLNELMAEIGLSNPELARILYGALVGMQELSYRDGASNADALATLVDLILALYEDS